MSQLASFDRPINAFVVGANGAVGRAIVIELLKDQKVATVFASSRSQTDFSNERIEHRHCDISNEESIAAAFSGIDTLDLVIVATGVLHQANGLKPEKTWRSLDAETLLQNFRINTIGPALVAKHVLPLFPRQGRAVFAALSARVASISDNRAGGWYGYRASKAALNQIIKTLSIELATKRPDALCLGLHPGTVDSNLSRPFQSGVPADKLFTPDRSARELLGVIDQRTPADTGKLFAWDGKEIAP